AGHGRRSDTLGNTGQRHARAGRVVARGHGGARGVPPELGGQRGERPGRPHQERVGHVRHAPARRLLPLVGTGAPTSGHRRGGRDGRV
ncbi:MAG: hypothetical protein AVDCRST_MAG04-2561, partial [uncultured Acetobacteraceae bacterium]